ncbi:MAG: hypothetical protein EOO38_00885 [Cytophagaceae bacterium]|nr:MAG: hypothetical protein EOO38_00885 [Cytophagaceae bacterium]
MHTKQKGELAEAMILARFLQLGWVVLTPFGDSQRYDLVVDRGNGFERIQVKSGRMINGTVLFQVCSNGNGTRMDKKDYHGQVEAFAVYCPKNAGHYLVPVAICGKRSCSLRIKRPRILSAEIIWAKDYELSVPNALRVKAT